MQHKPPGETTSEDLSALIGIEAEGKRLEFKRILPAANNEDRAEFLKDVSAMANTDGGDIIYGMAAVNGIASAFVPIENGRLDGEILRLHQILDGGVRPRIPGVEMQPIEIQPGKSLLVVRVPSSHIGPHQVTTGHSYRFHGRNTAGTYALEVDELRDKILRQASLPERMHDFRHSRIDLIRYHAEDMPSPVDYERKLIVHYLPEQTFGRVGSVDSALFTQASNRRRVDSAGAPTHAMVGVTPRANIDGYVFMNGRGDDALQFYIQVFDDGTIEFVDGAVFRVSTSEPLIYHETLEDTLFRQHDFARNVFSVLEVKGRIAIYASALGIRDCTIRPQAPTRTLDYIGHSTAIGRDPAFFNPLVIEDIRSLQAQEALEPLIQQVWRACAYDHAYSYKNGKYVGRNW